MKQKRFITLLSILGVLVILALVSILTGNKKEAGNFSSQLVQFSSEEVTKVQIFPQDENAFRIEKNGDDKWEMYVDGNKYNADSRGIDQLLNGILEMKALQVVSRNKDAWGNYSVDDSTGVRVQLFDDSDVLADLIVGRMDFGQPRNQYQRQPETFTYIRLKKSTDVYKVRGMLSMMIRNGQQTFRSGEISSCSRSNLGRVEYSYPADSSFAIVKQGADWLVDGMAPDSAQLAKYMNVVENFTSRSFASGDEAIPADQPAYRLSLSGPDMETINIEGWKSSEDKFLVISNANPGTVFSLSSSEFTRLFKGKSFFLDTSGG